MENLLGLRQFCIFGANGVLGTSVVAHLKKQNVSPERIHCIPWDEVGKPEVCTSQSVLKSKIEVFLNPSVPTDFIFCNGVTDPHQNFKAIYYSNLEFPERVVSAFQNFQNRFLTFGTIMEHFTKLCAQNSYLNSKLKLSQWVMKHSKTAETPGTFLHLRLHTLYGGIPKPHMFLGQIIQSIRTDTPFEMSSGEQLREYHHVDDIAASVVHLLEQEWIWAPLLEMNSGEPLKLVDLAKTVFKAFGKEKLLKVGSLIRSNYENLDFKFERSPQTILRSNREPIMGIIDWVKEWTGVDPNSENLQ
jgi:nucleoside-diphosphate-sugar epimerase